MSAPPRCEPPAEWRDRDGWHWVQQGKFAPTLARWHPSDRVAVEPLWTSAEHVYSATPAYAVRQWGWRYIAPVTPAAEVEALRLDNQIAVEIASTRGAEVAALRARVAGLEGTLTAIADSGWNNQPPALNLPDADWLRRCLRGIEAAARAVLSKEPTP